MFAVHFVRGMRPQLFQDNVSVSAHFGKMTRLWWPSNVSATLLLQEWDVFTGAVVGEMFKKEVTALPVSESGNASCYDAGFPLTAGLSCRSSRRGSTRSGTDQWLFSK